VANSNKMDEILAERGSRYGLFTDNACIAQALKEEARKWDAWNKMLSDQQEALDMFFVKISRMLSGDPNYSDNWRDIEGFARLVAERLEKSQN
jgi:hypothetical protein